MGGQAVPRCAGLTLSGHHLTHWTYVGPAALFRVPRYRPDRFCTQSPCVSEGVVPIAEPLAAYLQKQAVQAQGLPNPHGLVFHRKDGRPVDPSADSVAWHAALEAAELPPVKLHAARHTTATLLLIAGVDPKIVQAIMGHSSAAITRAYQHVDTSLSSSAMAAMSDLLGGGMPGIEGPSPG